MAIAIAVWSALALFLLGFWFWTSYVLYQQKQAWKAYALKNKLRYTPNKMLDSPEMTGVLDGFQVTVFTTDHGTAEGRTRRMMTSIEISLKSSMNAPLAVANGGMVKVVESLDLTQEYRPDIPEWDVSYVARSRELEVLRAYLTPTRLQEICRIMKIKRAWAILIFSGEVGLLRLDTPDALEKPGALQSIIQQLLAAARLFELQEGEDKLIQSQRRKDDGKQKVLRVDENLLRNTHGLSLEDD